jgi:hypothetical protein
VSLAYALLMLVWLRVIICYDPLHRVANDILGGIKGAGYQQPLLLSVVVFNLAYGPWAGEAWYTRYREEAANYFKTASSKDAIFQWLIGRILAESGRSEAAGLNSEDEWNEMITAEFLLRKGPKCLLTRWGSWLRCMMLWAHQWTRRTLILFIYGINMGWVTKSGRTAGSPGHLIMDKFGAKRKEKTGGAQGGSSAGLQGDDEQKTMKQHCAVTSSRQRGSGRWHKTLSIWRSYCTWIRRCSSTV